MKLTSFDIYKDLLIEKSGLVVTPDKSYLLESRLTPVAKKHGFVNLDAMGNALRGIPNAALVTAIIEAMTTTETSFFRDFKPFETFKSILPYFLEKRAAVKKLRIWCAAASSGQEPYSIAMILKDLQDQGKMPGWRFEIIGTDISNNSLEQAKRGVYSQFDVQRGLPIQLLMKHFEQDGTQWAISEDIKRMVTYKNFNLLDSMLSFGTFDIVLCRNVLIYFNEQTQADVLRRIGKQMDNDGALFLGKPETVLEPGTDFNPVPAQSGLYALNGSTHLIKPAA